MRPSALLANGPRVHLTRSRTSLTEEERRWRLTEATRQRLTRVTREAAWALSRGAITEGQYAELMADVRAQEPRVNGGDT